MPPTELHVVSFVLRHQPYVAAPDNLGGTISSFLGPSSNLSLSNACKFGSLKLLDWIWDSSCTPARENISGWSLSNFLRSEPNYYRWQCSKALEVATHCGDLKIVKWLFQHFSGCVVPVKAVEAAAANGHLIVLKFLLDQDAGRHTCAQLDRDDVSKDCKGSGNAVLWGRKSMVKAIINGHSDVAQWLHQNVPHHDFERAICAALHVGDMELAQLLVPPNRTIFDYAVNCSDAAVIEMVFHAGHLQQNRNDVVATIRNLVEQGHMQRSAPIFINHNLWRGYWQLIIRAAIWRGDIPMFQWLVKHPTGQELIEQANEPNECLGFLIDAAGAGHVGVMQHLYEEDMADGYETALADAVRNGHLDAVKWLMIHITEYDAQLLDRRFMDKAAKHGHLDILKFLHGKEAAMLQPKCPNQSQTERYTVGTSLSLDRTECHVYEGLAAMKTIRSNSCSDRAMDDAAAHGYLEVVQWLHANRGEGCTTHAMDKAAANGHLDVVKWLHHNRLEGCTTQAMDDAAKKGNLESMQWLRDNRHEGCTFKAIEDAIANGHLQVASWLQKNYPQHAPALVGKSICEDSIFDVLLFLHVHHPHVFTVWFCSRIQGDNVGEWLEKHYPDHAASDESPN